ncbi:MAG: hypothetical protein AVDCRST_MAG27-2231, partial [uncultured Craurococcus sp.]
EPRPATPRRPRRHAARHPVDAGLGRAVHPAERHAAPAGAAARPLRHRLPALQLRRAGDAALHPARRLGRLPPRQSRRADLARRHPHLRPAALVHRRAACAAGRHDGARLHHAALHHAWRRALPARAHGRRPLGRGADRLRRRARRRLAQSHGRRGPLRPRDARLLAALRRLLPHHQGADPARLAACHRRLAIPHRCAVQPALRPAELGMALARPVGRLRLLRRDRHGGAYLPDAGLPPRRHVGDPADQIPRAGLGLALRPRRLGRRAGDGDLDRRADHLRQHELDRTTRGTEARL